MSAIEKSAVQGAQKAYTPAETKKTDRRSGDYGKTVGDPKLSEKAQKYYEELKKKYSNMDFVLVSRDQKAAAQANAGAYANPSKTVVLIDEDKIEKMATDEKYRKQYEGIIANAGKDLSKLKSELESAGKNVKGFGMQVNDDGSASYFAVLQKKKAAAKKEAKKAAEKKEAKKAEEKRTAKKRAEKKAQEDKSGKVRSKKEDESDDEEYVTIKANSVEELMRKIQDLDFAERSDSVRTDGEKMVGEHIDFRG